MKWKTAISLIYFRLFQQFNTGYHSFTPKAFFNKQWCFRHCTSDVIKGETGWFFFEKKLWSNFKWLYSFIYSLIQTFIPFYVSLEKKSNWHCNVWKKALLRSYKWKFLPHHHLPSSKYLYLYLCVCQIYASYKQLYPNFQQLLAATGLCQASFLIYFRNWKNSFAGDFDKYEDQCMSFSLKHSARGFR